jgi:hypothetical protein
MNEKLLASIRFYFAQCVFTAKCHFKAYDRLIRKKNSLSRIVKTVSIGTLFVLIFQIIGLQKQYQELLNILAYVGLLLTGTSLAFEVFNKDDLAQNILQHKKYAENYNRLRDICMALIEETMSNALTDEKTREKRDDLQKNYNELGEDSPQTTGEDYIQAQVGLGIDKKSEKNGEEFTWSDEEIDKFLPNQLRLTKK